MYVMLEMDRERPIFITADQHGECGDPNCRLEILKAELEEDYEPEFVRKAVILEALSSILESRVFVILQGIGGEPVAINTNRVISVYAIEGSASGLDHVAAK